MKPSCNAMNVTAGGDEEGVFSSFLHSDFATIPTVMFDPKLRQIKKIAQISC